MTEVKSNLCPTESFDDAQPALRQSRSRAAVHAKVGLEQRGDVLSYFDGPAGHLNARGYAVLAEVLAADLGAL